MKWDYKIIVLRDQIDPEKMAEELKNLGLEGWEAVGVAPKFNSPQYIAILKRPEQQEAGV